MGLPNIGPLELIIILAIALLIVGPRRLPEMGSAVGRTIREFRKASTEISDASATQAEPKPAAPAQPAPAALGTDSTATATIPEPAADVNDEAPDRA
jgi:sec-independent protein translocase protein TatA